MRNFDIHYYTLSLNSEKYKFGENVRMVMLSDLHGNSYGENNAELLRAVMQLNPDLVMLAGDMITAVNAPAPKCVLALLRGLASRYPVFYGNGNHETFMKMNQETDKKLYFQKYRKKLRKAGVVFLENQSARIEIKGFGITVYGLEAGTKYFKRFHSKRMQSEVLHARLGAPDRKTYTVLLAHNPMDFQAYAQWGADLVLSGHLHGGFMRLPVLGGVISPQMQFFPKYDKGLYKIKESTMIVSSGIGNHFPPPRLFNRPELVVIDLTAS